ncbi:MAG: retroviral-like aspartic protease [Deltaproteobacteria bacterium]|nr:retroviral-like aspartic protease [Deltaproteobacteria bacterium]
MSKPVLDVTVVTLEGKKSRLKALFDTGSYYSIIRSDVVPKGTVVPVFRKPEVLRTAGRTGTLSALGVVELTFVIGKRMVRDGALVSPDLGRELLIGSKTMQAWGITVRNKGGKTRVHVGSDMRDPEITEVD